VPGWPSRALRFPVHRRAQARWDSPCGSTPLRRSAAEDIQWKNRQNWASSLKSPNRTPSNFTYEKNDFGFRLGNRGRIGHSGRRELSDRRWDRDSVSARGQRPAPGCGRACPGLRTTSSSPGLRARSCVCAGPGLRPAAPAGGLCSSAPDSLRASGTHCLPRVRLWGVLPWMAAPPRLVGLPLSRTVRLAGGVSAGITAPRWQVQDGGPRLRSTNSRQAPMAVPSPPVAGEKVRMRGWFKWTPPRFRAELTDPQPSPLPPKARERESVRASSGKVACQAMTPGITVASRREQAGYYLRGGD
jgi:hypothetical protein